MAMSEEQLVSLLPLFRGDLRDAVRALSGYPELGRVEIGSIRKILGYSGEPTRKLSDEQRDALVEEYRGGGTSIRKLAAKYGITGNAVRGILLRRHVDTSPMCTWSDIRKRRLIYFRKEGLSYHEIARRMGASVNSIVHQAHRLGFPKESSGLDPYVQTFDPFSK